MCLNETYSRVHVGKNLSYVFPIRNDLQQGDVLSPLIYNFALEYSIKRVQVNQDGLSLNGANQLLVYADDINILGGSVHTVKQNAEDLVVASKVTGIEVNADKIKYMVMSRNQNAGRSQYIKIHNSSFERVEEFKCLGTILRNQNYIQKEFKSRWKSENACYHLVHNLLSFSLISETLKIKICRTIILLVVVYECEIWSLILREERRLSGFENRVLRRIFEPKRDEVTGEWRKLHNEEFKDLHSSPNNVRVMKSRRMRRAGHVARMGERRGVYRVLVGKLEGKRPLARPRRRWEDNNNKLDLQEVGCAGMDWIELAQDRDKWRALENAVMNLLVP